MTTNTKNPKCQHCQSKTRQTKPYIIADNLEEPRWLCKACKQTLDEKVMLKFCGME
jgi:transposase-like protein